MRKFTQNLVKAIDCEIKKWEAIVNGHSESILNSTDALEVTRLREMVGYVEGFLLFLVALNKELYKSAVFERRMEKSYPNLMRAENLSKQNLKVLLNEAQRIVQEKMQIDIDKAMIIRLEYSIQILTSLLVQTAEAPEIDVNRYKILISGQNLPTEILSTVLDVIRKKYCLTDEENSVGLTMENFVANRFRKEQFPVLPLQ